jgi:hypothetical protein
VCHVTAHFNGIEDPSVASVLREFLYARLNFDSDTMKNATWMGSVAMGIVRDPEHKRMFMELMRDTLSDFLEESVGQRPDYYSETPAPEHEKSGST